MPTFMVILRHSPENCDWFNAKSRKASLEFMGKVDELMKKHEIKMLGAWTRAQRQERKDKDPSVP